MNQSDKIDQLAGALNQFHLDFIASKSSILKDTKGYNYKYASLDQILDITRPLLSKNNLSIVQLGCDIPGEEMEYVTVETILMHSSGQFISNKLSMPFKINAYHKLTDEISSVVDIIRPMVATHDGGQQAFERLLKGVRAALGRELIKNIPQEVGKYLTYARRYSIAAILNLAACEDTDANQGE